eukprot:7769911-Lingulodinium_polyedra.AAC.1
MAQDYAEQGKIEEWLAIVMPSREDSVSQPEPFNVLEPPFLSFIPDEASTETDPHDMRQEFKSVEQDSMANAVNVDFFQEMSSVKLNPGGEDCQLPKFGSASVNAAGVHQVLEFVSAHGASWQVVLYCDRCYVGPQRRARPALKPSVSGLQHMMSSVRAAQRDAAQFTATASIVIITVTVI